MVDQGRLSPKAQKRYALCESCGRLIAREEAPICPQCLAIADDNEPDSEPDTLHDYEFRQALHESLGEDPLMPHNEDAP